jgi:FdhD protein
MGRVTVRRRVLKINGVRSGDRVDTLAAEEPLEIRISGRPLTVTMRTPGDDFDLVAGFLAGEGIIAGAHDLTSMRICTDTDESGKPTFNVVDVTPAEGVAGPETWTERAFTTTSACGVCGTSSIEALARRTRYDLADDDTKVDASVLAGLPGTLRAAQRVFERTGGLHAAGLFDTAGRLVAVREDVGRHNAVDKVVGWALREELLPLRRHVLMVSGRASFELVQKAVLAGIPMLAAVSAPSSLAVDLAEASALTLVGFLRGDSMNVYTGESRIVTLR